MAASNSSNDKKKYYKLREDKTDNSPSKGEMRFIEQVKTASGWTVGEEFNSMSGYLQSVSIKTYEYEGATKEALQIELLDNEDDKTSLIFTLGFNTFMAQNILNTLAGEELWNVLSFTAGKPNNGYPTLWINNSGQKTKWKFSKENNNSDLIPKVTSSIDEEGNKIKKGVKANLEFWKSVLAEVAGRCTLATKSGAVATKQADIPAENKSTLIDSDDSSDLPF